MIFPAPNSPTIPQVFHKAPCSLTTSFTSQPHLLPPSALFAELQASLLPFLVSNISPPTPARSLPCLKALHLLLPHPGSHFLALFRVQFHVIYSGRPSLIPVPLHSLPHRPVYFCLCTQHTLPLHTYLFAVHFQFPLNGKLLQEGRVGFCQSDSLLALPVPDTW